jgi:hydrogenase maturation protease
MKKILIAGIGNIFLGDDAFGCEVLREMTRNALPEGVAAIDFGVRSYDLAYALNDGAYDAIILVDSTARGKEPGTVFLIEPDLSRLEEFERTAVDAHSMNPVSVIQMAQSLGGVNGKLYLVGCEPAVLESENGEIGLSEKVREAVQQAIGMIQSLVNDLLDVKQKLAAGMAAV